MIAGRTAIQLVVHPIWVLLIGDLLCEPSEIDPFDHLFSPGIRAGRDASLLDPAPEGVVRDAQQVGRHSNSHLRHAP